MLDRNQLDHILPRGYLEGFTIPDTKERLHVFNIERRTWFETSIGNVAAENGYYDYALDGEPDETADQTFSEFEANFPPFRREMAASQFSMWTKHRDFLVRYAQMLRARSTLFREHILKDLANATFMQLGEELERRPSLTRPGEFEFKYRYSEFKPHNEQHRGGFFKNISITKMRQEITRGACDFASWHWCLRFTTDVTKPFVTSDNAVGLMGPAPSLAEAMAHPDTLFLFPFCWQACLLGSPRKFDVETDAIDQALRAELQRLYLNENSCRFAYSPHPIQV